MAGELNSKLSLKTLDSMPLKPAPVGCNAMDGVPSDKPPC